MTTYAEATTAATQPQIVATILSYLAAAGSPVAGLPASSPDRGVVEAEAFYLGLNELLRVAVAQSVSATTALAAGDSWVDAAATWYGLTRLPATAALWSVPLVVSPGAAPLTLAPGAIIQVQASDPKSSVFSLAIPSGSPTITLSAGSSYKASAPFVARLVGTPGNVTPGQIVKVITGPAGLQIDLTATQALITAARDVETSPQLITRCLGRWGTIGAGWTAQAFDYLVPLFAPTITQWIVRDDNPYGPGTVGVVLADAAGPATDGEVAAVQAGLGARDVRPLGSGKLLVTKASNLTVDVTAVLHSDGSNGTLSADAMAALAQLQAVFPLGGTLDPSLLVGLLRGDEIGSTSIVVGSRTVTVQLGAPGFASVSGVVLTLPIGPIILTWYQRLVLNPTIVFA